MSVESPGPVRAYGLVFDVAGASAQGPRQENQDAFTVTRFPQLGLVAVADGMGGQRAGRVAAETAIEAVTGAGPIRSLDAARYAIRSADDAVARTAGGDPAKLEGMGAALTVMALTQDRAGGVGWLVANVGDVRVISRSPDGVVRLETRDHTPAFARWEAGEIALDEIPDSPGANRLQRAVGHGGEADTTWIPVRAGWTFLVHSDGVTKAMRLDELGAAMAMSSSAAACEAIERKVEERGPDDNYTAVVVRVLADDGAAAPGDATLPSPGPAPQAAPPSRRAAEDTRLVTETRRGPFNPPDDVNSRRSPLGALGAGLAVLALALGGYGLFTGMQARDDATAARAETAALQARIDSLAQRVPPDTAGRLPVSATDSGAKAAAAPPAAPAPAPRTPNGR
ncbi:PP2C family protein-serine/threonine phosphatase [Longimicrobium sp.]|uniref:PP2C family protein-serine/threonine phosphatase n=1 Tax=Longimicrobium sp. TaxID=2029185 RepID=UPI002C394AA1|nr:protein phosphatase 2C domain-containing protein [Longimicrobium sp.]HSU17061.1 protein phosphatase 2C domain-containing protein [Longimicrobium sp.]